MFGPGGMGRCHVQHVCPMARQRRLCQSLASTLPNVRQSGGKDSVVLFLEHTYRRATIAAEGTDCERGMRYRASDLVGCSSSCRFCTEV